MDKILVVDDESDIVNLLKLILETEGYRVLPAYDGDEALGLAQMEVPDLVLLDLMMPGKSGLEVCRTLKNQQRTRNTPVIVFTALGRDVDRKLSKEAGADAHLTKPLTHEEILAEVRRCLSEARGWKFSRQLGIDHSKLVGRKILLEFDPRTDYERIVRDFAMECAFLRETVIIVTQKGSTIQQALEGDMGIKVMDLDLMINLPAILSENPNEPVSMVFDSLTDLGLSGNPENGSYTSLYKFVQASIQALAEPRITAVFLLNPSAHDPKVVASLRGIFNSQLVYEKRGLTVARLA